MADSNPKKSTRALLTRIVDYAGLFPPSQLSMPHAVANYAAYQNSRYQWMLGRFVVPVARLGEFAESAKDFFSADQEIWRLSVLAGEDIQETVRQIEDFNARYAPFAVCDALEAKAETSRRIAEISEAVAPELKTYFEIPIEENLVDLISTLAVAGRCAKIRTGGVTAEAFPPIEKIIRFMRVCLAANVPFKATAGLHHPLRALKSLTYEADAPEAVMNGFINVFLAAAFLRQGSPPKLVNELLKDRQADNFLFSDDGVLWRQEHFISSLSLENLRIRGAISFGSCSFVEPVEDLQEIGLL
ncbi:MAG: hypothetical protein LH614_06640 [Pyrinomonadaceae bacterium]|nr:hypothetical protein [Pyrinomonadaceae bacterium]